MKILICGCGAIGSNLAALLAVDLRGEHEITVLDKDKVEERNTQAGTQYFLPFQIGELKTEALQYRIYKDFSREVEIVNGNVKLVLPSRGKDLVIDCLDNKEAREISQVDWKNKLAESPFALLHLGFSDKMTFAIEWAENYQVPDNQVQVDICEMPGAASFVKLVASLGSLVVQDFLTTGKKRDFCGNQFVIREIK